MEREVRVRGGEEGEGEDVGFGFEEVKRGRETDLRGETREEEKGRRIRKENHKMW